MFQEKKYVKLGIIDIIQEKIKFIILSKKSEHKKIKKQFTCLGENTEK